ncbi:MAG: transcriptional repressor [Candidatus Margulisiibacteriota bacterium]
MDKAKETFEDFLREKGLRSTAQRALILDTFLKTEKHVSAEEFFLIIKKKDSSIGLATVHRNLKLLRDAGLAREVDFADGKKRFEHLLGHQHHDHLICVKCGTSIEVFNKDIEKLQEKLALSRGFKPQTHRMDIFGICSHCG